MCVFGNARGGIGGPTPIKAEIGTIAEDVNADLIAITEVGCPKDTQPPLGKYGKYKPAGVAATKTSKITHAGAGIWKSNSMPVAEIDMQISDDIPGFQAVELKYTTFKIILF